MYNFKKIFGVIFLLACIILPQTVSAEKRDYKDNYYNFRNIRRVVLLDVSSDIDFRREGDIFIRNLRNTYYDNARKLKVEIITESQARQMTGSSNPRDFAQIADLYIQCDIKD